MDSFIAKVGWLGPTCIGSRLALLCIRHVTHVSRLNSQNELWDADSTINIVPCIAIIIIIIIIIKKFAPNNNNNNNYYYY